MIGRPRSLAAGLLLTTALGAAGAATPPGARDAQAIKAQIQAVLDAPEFSTTREDHEYQYRGPRWWDDTQDGAGSRARDPAGSRPSLVDWIELAVTIVARFAEVVLWALLIAAVVLLIVHRERWRRLLPAGRGRRTATAPVAAITSGTGAPGERLPDDVAAAARRLWHDGDVRGCVGLLYRGALAALAAHPGLELPESATERDCVQRIRAGAPAPAGEYFCELTTVWQAVAYADQTPAPSRLERLCDAWREHFGEPP